MGCLSYYSHHDFHTRLSSSGLIAFHNNAYTAGPDGDYPATPHLRLSPTQTSISASKSSYSQRQPLQITRLITTKYPQLQKNHSKSGSWGQLPRPESLVGQRTCPHDPKRMMGRRT